VEIKLAQWGWWGTTTAPVWNGLFEAFNIHWKMWLVIARSIRRVRMPIVWSAQQTSSLERA
jgi:hypothetical protein